MGKKQILCLLFMIFLVGDSFAQQKRQTNPVRRLAPGTAWIVEDLPTGSSILAKEKSPTQIEGKTVEKNLVGKGYRRQEILKSGHWDLQFITEEFLLTRQGDGTFDLVESDEIEESHLPRLTPYTLREFFWIKGLGAVEQRMVDGVPCHIYIADALGNSLELTDEARKRIYYVAAIGQSDGFPRRLETPSRSLRYVPQPRVAQPEALPAAAQAAIDAYREKLRKVIQQYALPR